MTCHKHMLRGLLLGLGLVVATASFGQTWDEWFEQSKTEIKYLEKQIAELQLLMTDIEKGYKIVQQGLQTISDIKHGDFNLHSSYFASLLSANPAVGASSTVTDCYSLQASITTACRGLGSQVTGSPLFSVSDQKYIQLVIGNLQTQMGGAMADLANLTGNGNFSLTDQQRQQRIMAVHATLVSQYQFIQHFAAQVRLLGAQRMQEQSDGQAIQNMYP